MNPVYLEIIILAIVGVAGVFAHAFKAVDDKNKEQDAEYTFSMYWKKRRFIMFFSAICIIVFSFYQHEWAQFEKLGNWRGLIVFGMGYMSDSAFPSLFNIIPLIIDKAKNMFGGKKETEQ